jgi:hypothetical protein
MSERLKVLKKKPLKALVIWPIDFEGLVRSVRQWFLLQRPSKRSNECLKVLKPLKALLGLKTMYIL